MKDKSIVQTAKERRILHLLEKLRDGSLTKSETQEIEAHFERDPDGINWRGLGRNQVLEALSISSSTLSNWTRAGCPHKRTSKKTSYDLAEIHEWRLQRERDAQSTRAGLDGDLTGGAEETEALEAYRRVKTEEARFKLDRERGLYIETSEHQRLMREAALMVRTGLERMGEQLAVKLSKASQPVDCKRMVEDAVYSIVRNIVTEQL